MKSMIKNCLSFILIFCSGLQLSAQDGTVTSGGIATGTGGSATYSIGQVNYSASGGGGSVSQGLQQPFEITTQTGIEDQSIRLSLSVHPNPATDYLVLTSTHEHTAYLKLALYSIDGKMLKEKRVTSSTTVIEMKDYAKGVYLLKVSEGEKEIKSFKIIKNN